MSALMDKAAIEILSATGNWESDERKVLYFYAVEESHSGVITAADAIVAIIEDPLFSILKQDPNVTHSAGQIGGPCFEHDPASPRFKLLMKHLIPDTKIGVFFTLRLLSRIGFCSFLREVSHRW